MQRRTPGAAGALDERARGVEVEVVVDEAPEVAPDAAGDLRRTRAGRTIDQHAAHEVADHVVGDADAAPHVHRDAEHARALRGVEAQELGHDVRGHRVAHGDGRGGGLGAEMASPTEACRPSVALRERPEPAQEGALEVSAVSRGEFEADVDAARGALATAMRTSGGCDATRSAAASSQTWRSMVRSAPTRRSTRATRAAPTPCECRHVEALWFFTR
jgi:hypothetical protein